MEQKKIKHHNKLLYEVLIVNIKNHIRNTVNRNAIAYIIDNLFTPVTNSNPRE